MKLLLPPGLGDLHWCMLKLKPWIDRLGIAPEVSIASNDPSKNRAKGYVELLPFVRWGSYVDIRGDRDTFGRVFSKGEAVSHYRIGGETFDLYIGCNHCVHHGWQPEDWWKDVFGQGADYRYPIDFTRGGIGSFDIGLFDKPFVLVSFYRHGWYSDWGKHLPPFKVIEQIRKRLPDHEIVITGASWDVEFCSAVAQRNRIRSIAGKTTVHELLMLAKMAEVWVGHAAGNGMLAAHLKTPTVLLWGRPPFPIGMWDCWVAPDAFYAAVDVRHEHAEGHVFHAIDDLLELKELA